MTTKTYYHIVMHDVIDDFGEPKTFDIEYFIDIYEVVDDWSSSNYEVYKIIVEKLNMQDY